ncbi:hypothetical protein Taro_016331 [Colocasia esculenta]|uniref:Amino acid transporter transmembrane domain-containing protein n=1 Tax=Colocasia esculenta TaxID=4460 RepID=A0A843UPU1_COLES|nr:hypothetical protein [Colocasia esculenta]
MGEEGEPMEVKPLPETPLGALADEVVIRAPASQLWKSPSLTSPAVMRAVASVREYLEEVGHLTRPDPQDACLPITESRKGNAFYAAFHTLSSGIGFQALLLPVAFASLGWTWGIITLSLAFIWQLYTIWLLTQLHESSTGTRYSRYLNLCMVAFGDRLAKCLAKFPTMYLSAGTCTTLIFVGGGSMKLFFEIVCGTTCKSKPLTTIEWYLVFICLAVVLAQLPNLNSIAVVSFIGSITAISYCTIIWVMSVAKGRPDGISYEPAGETESEVRRVLAILNGLGIIAFVFRGHNLVLEIQATMPSTSKQPSHVPMWRGVKFAYAIIACCLFPIAIAGYWAYGNLIPPRGILSALHRFHGKDTSRAVLGLVTMIVVINCLTMFPIYAMPVFDNLESGYTSRRKKPCPRWLRSGIRVFFGSAAFLIAVAFPFLPDLAGLLGGLSLPVTMAYPCFMWVVMNKTKRYSRMWNANLMLGVLGMALSLLLLVGAVWRIADKGLNLRLFRPGHDIVADSF